MANFCNSPISPKFTPAKVSLYTVLDIVGVETKIKIKITHQVMISLSSVIFVVCLLPGYKIQYHPYTSSYNWFLLVSVLVDFHATTLMICTQKILHVWCLLSCDPFDVCVVMMLLLQKSERYQLQKAAKGGDVVTLEKLINTRYIDVNTTDPVSTLYGYCQCGTDSSSEGCTHVVNV